MRLKLLALYALPLACALIPPTAAQTKRASAKPFVVVESGKGFDLLQQAVDAIGDGRGTIRIASGTYQQCAVQTSGRISYVAADAGGAIFDQSVCEGQAALILGGESARIDGAIFQNYRGNSGHSHHAIAWQNGSLSIVNSLFRASDDAIVSGDVAGSNLTISQSSFADAGLHIGRAAKFRMTTTTLANAPLRANAVQVEWDDNIFEDANTTAAPMIALPNGGTGRIEHNHFRPHSVRPSDAPLISVALDARGPMARSLVVKDNHAAFAQGESGQALFVKDGSADGVSLGANELGTGITAYQRR